ncbi:LolA-like putative outer membrane lipoprotein chaperone [Hoylesella pleuritidis]|uniref:LolA-like putative outer membrane lipoprotein chaperone n=1 Tax=Hoylesella pleuritidis TaxID=407975 RepID=UPI0023530E1B|nr:LolA-like putative outer membrane lipoprotein chaperone [Hoylesella pleuritidis]
MKRIILLSIFLSLVAFANINAQNAGQARAILDQTASVIGHKGGARATFKMAGSKFGNISGNIAIKGNKFYANTPKTIVWYNGKTQWTYMRATNEVNISTPDETKQAAMNPYTFINIYRKGYDMGVKSVGKSYQVHLVAQNKSRGIQEFYISVDKNTYVPNQIKIHQSGGWTTIDISNFQTKNLNDNVFTFPSKDYPSAEIIDLR